MHSARGRDGLQLPWIACNLPLEPLTDGYAGPGLVSALTLDALRLTGSAGLSPGAAVRLAFRLPDQRQATVVTGRVTRLDPPDPAVAAAVAEVAISTIEGSGTRAYHQYVLAHASRQALERQAEALLTPAGRLIPITGADRIGALLAESLAHQAEALLHGPDLAAPLRASLSAVSADGLVLTLPGEGDRILAGTRVRCSFLSRHGPYLFEADVRARVNGQLHLGLPERLHRYEKRAEPRTALASERATAAAGDAAVTAAAVDRIVITLPAPYGGVLDRPLVDVSERGAAFRSRPGDPLFLPGTPLPQVVLVRDGRPGPPRPAEVRQVSREEPAGPVQTPGAPGRPEGEEAVAYRVGLVLDVERGRFLPAPHAAPAAAAPAAGAGAGRRWLLRLIRTARGSFASARARLAGRRPRAGAPLVNVVRYRGRDGEAIVALLNSTQPLGRAGVRLRGPLVVIPPPYGKTKETYAALALMLVETFRRHGRDVVVVRYDGVRAVGESHKDPEDWAEGRQMMHYTLSQGAADLLATLDYFHGRPWFRPTHTVIVSFSFAALSARRAILDDPFGRVTHWLSVMGAADAQDVIFNATGGIDLIASQRMGLRYGPISVLGHLVDADHFGDDAVRAGLATPHDARRDLARIRIPITWFVGRDDRWVRAERIHDVMSVAAPAPRAVVELPVGHTIRSSAEALASFETITRHLWTQLYGEMPLPVRLDEKALKRVSALERGRLPRRRIADARDYWERYLLGEDGRGVGFDLWATTPAYRELLDLQRQLLDLSEGDVVADLGAGTGNFVEHLLERLVRDGFRTSPRRLIVADLVGPALALAREKAARVLEGVLVPADFLEFRELNLETSRLRPVRRFLAGEFASLDRLRGLIDGLPDSTLDTWLALYDDRLHAWLRGAPPDGPLRAHVSRALRGGDLEVAVEFNRAARWVLGRLTADDLKPDLDPATTRALLAEPRRARAEQLRFEHLRLAGPGLDDALPFPDASLDKVLLSLVLSYLFDPGESLREVHRALRPGGRLVASTMRPDADLSRTVEELVEQVAGNPDVARRFGVSADELKAALQKYLNQAASIIDLEEGGVFHFFSREELARLLEEAGFDQVKVYESSGRPPQIFVAVGVKR